MDSSNLQTASLYINNLLLSRGLLRHGTPIEFSRPDRVEGGTDATMARVINLVHDLVLRRDRESEQRENLALTVRSLRQTETRQTLEIERLTNKAEDLTRQLNTASGQERVWKGMLRTAENSCRGLREEMLRLKTTLQQVRMQCANDIRKRDVQLARMKKHLEATQQRGVKAPTTNTTITITPGVTTAAPTGMSVFAAQEDNEAPYSLQQETTEFLTQLSQSLSDENDNLIGLVRSSLQTLRSLQGLSDPSTPSQTHDAHDAIPDDEPVLDVDSNLLHALPTSYETLSTEMDSVLEHLRTLLTNPSFVPIEEVAVREDEIVRLREGWVKMEARWRETVAMMDEWRRKIVKGGARGVDLEELQMKLGVLGAGDPRKNVGSGKDAGTEERGQEDLYDDEGEDSAGETENADGKLFDEEPDLAFLDDQIDEDEVLGAGLRPDASVLGEVNGNIQSPQKQDRFSAIPEESSQGAPQDGEEDEVDLLNASAMAAPSKAENRVLLQEKKGEKEARIQTQIVKVRFTSDSRIPRHTAQKRNISGTSAEDEAEPRPKSRQSPASQATIQKKLEATRLEAEKALAASAAKPQRRQKDVGGRVPSAGVTKGVTGGLNARRKVSASSARAARRRSTLSPEELESLIMGGVGGG